MMDTIEKMYVCMFDYIFYEYGAGEIEKEREISCQKEREIKNNFAKEERKRERERYAILYCTDNAKHTEVGRESRERCLSYLPKLFEPQFTH